MFLTEVAKNLNKHRIPYAIVGGFAVVLHGAVRGTVDVDLITKLNQSNLNKLEKCMNEIGLSSRLPISAEDLVNFRNEYINNRNLIAWNFIDPSDPTRQVDVLITEDLSGKKSEKKKIQNTEVKVLAKKDLIKMKRTSGRAQDLEDIKALEKLP